MQIIERMLMLLETKDLKMADLCRYLDINTSTMTNWKNRNTDPPAKYIAPICEFLNVSIEYLLTGIEKSIFHSRTEQEWMNLLYKVRIDKHDKYIGYVEGYIDAHPEDKAESKVSGN